MAAPKLEDLESLLAVLGSLGAFIVFLAAGWWKLSGKFHEILTTVAALATESGKLRGQIAAGVRQATTVMDILGKRIGDLERSLAVQATLLGEREKDGTKLEAKMEQAHDDVLKVVASLSQVMGSLDQVWRTHPAAPPDGGPKAGRG